MSQQVLVITAHPLDHTVSNSMAVAKQFVQSYADKNPNDKITTINLYEEDIPFLDKDVLTAWGALQAGAEFNTLSSEQQQKVTRLGHIVEQFVTANKYVFVSPLWNFSVPPMLKAYVDAIAIPGKTFKYTETGPVGLLTDKKIVHIQARGGVYSNGPMKELEMGNNYLHTMFVKFLGVPSYDEIIIEGLKQFPDQVAAIKGKALLHAQELAKTF